MPAFIGIGLNQTLKNEQQLSFVCQLHLAAELHLDMMFYNEKLSTWEPLIEPVMEKEGVYRPWEVLIKVSAACTLQERKKELVYRLWEVLIKVSAACTLQERKKELVYRPLEDIIKVSAACTLQERKNKEGVYRPWEVLIKGVQHVLFMRGRRS